MIRLDRVTKEYFGKAAVADLTLTVAEGEFAILIGPSGCGKSTTLRMINRLIEVTRGTIAIDGTNVEHYRPEELRRRIGYAIQNVGLFPHMTVAQNIAVVPKLLRWDESRRDRRTDELLDLFSLDPAEYRTKYPHQLSGGEAQRVGVARALAADPAILLMDEPFGALDPITRESLQIEFARIQRELKKTIVFVTHDIDEAIRLANRIVILKEGRLVQAGTPEAILTAPVDRFVMEFIGTDRALKRLSRLSAADFMVDAPSIGQEMSLSEAGSALADHRYLWVVDGLRRPVGWLDGDDLGSEAATAAEAMTRMDYRTEGIAADATLREALSRMIQGGIRGAPVVDEGGELLGEIRLSDILDA
ncbi:MAG: ABC transporter ATP-binding protein [bacterium]|nr:MAG: ABC transporter ATP-binding protein [bacterium]